MSNQHLLTISATQHAVPSQDGLYIAALNGERLEVRAAASLGLVRTVSPLSKGPIIRWSPVFSAEETSSRFLVADEENVRVWDLYNERWAATISNGSGGMGKIVNVEFGRTKEDVICFSEFGSKVTIWSLKTGRSVEIRDPKFPSTRTFGFRPITGLCAILSRPGPHDVLTLHVPSSYAVLKMVTLQSVDAQGMRWSPDGRWLAVWDTPSIGYKVYIYTADGHLYRVYNGDCGEHGLGLGVKSIEWSPKSDHLAIGGHDRRVTLLSTRTVSFGISSWTMFVTDRCSSPLLCFSTTRQRYSSQLVRKSGRKKSRHHCSVLTRQFPNLSLPP